MTDIKVLMVPQPDKKKPGTSGIDRVIEAYYKYLPDFGVKLIKFDKGSYDLTAVHAGLTAGKCDVAHLHGLYWTADYDAALWEYHSNASIVEALRHARQVTVPSAWVAETLQRDMRFTPHVIGHGIDWDEWQKPSEPLGDYVLWNKNRAADVCDPTPVVDLAKRFPRGKFVTTFVPKETPNFGNVKVIELIPYAEMKKLVQSAYVYLSTTKESFGIGILEAMASGVPVLGYAHGGILELVEHGVNGYLAQPGKIDDLANGLNYCLRNRAVLGANGRELARAWTWPRMVERVAEVYRLALEPEPPTVSVIIPVYNKSEEEVRRAVESAIIQTYQPTQVVVVDDGSTNGADYETLIRELGTDADCNLMYRRYENSGVAVARNRGIELTQSKYICCLDSDDWLAPDFLRVCVEALEADRSLGVAYTSLYYHRADGSHGLSAWPDQWVYDDQILRKNQIPTACVFRREAWKRTGGYKQRYAPGGAGEEDAEFWTRLGAYGYKAELVEPHATLVPKYLDLKARAARIPSPQQMTDAGLANDWPLVESSLFHYSWESGQVSGDKTRRPTDWLAWHPWVKDGQHPLASYATPSNHRHPSHPVRQYDEPMVSVIIPVGPGHEKTVIDALDSLEAQTFRKWEAIVVWDSKVDPTDILDAYPYVNWQTTELNKSGAGHARNVGTRYARAPFLFFLDADDWLYPEALEKHIDAWADGKPAVIYSDYVGKAIGVDTKGLADDIEVLHYFQHNDEYVLGYRAADYDCEHAQRQPELPRPFIWCNVTALVPKSWHEKIGGFDEAMESWEDVDYHWRLARAGYCYRRIPERLMVYRFYTGSRRDSGLQKHKSLVQYLRQKYEGLKTMPCSGCGGSTRRRTVTSVKATTAPAQRAASPAVGSETVAISDDEFVLIRLADGNRGDHPVIGFNTKRQYGHHQDGQKFLMDHRDVFTVNKRTGQTVLVSEFFQPVEERPLNLPQEEKPAPPPPEPMIDDVPEETTPDVWAQEDDAAWPLDLQTIPGVNKDIADELAARGLTSAEAILEVGEEGLVDIKGIGPFKAKKIIGHLRIQQGV